MSSRRLEVLAAAFRAPSMAPLDALDADPRTVLDLGCGPGHTTAMLADRFPTARVTGLDASAGFVREARSTYRHGCHFEVADVIVLPLPCAPAAMIYARFLLAHLPDVCALVDARASQLRPGGRLIIEEPESIQTNDEVFTRYLRLAENVVRLRGSEMVSGPLVGACCPHAGRVVLNRVAEHDVQAASPRTGSMRGFVTARTSGCVGYRCPAPAMQGAW